MLAHLFAYVGIPALLALVGIRLRDESLEKTETYRTFRHPAREDVRRRAAQRESPVVEREMFAWPSAIPENLGCLARFDRARLPRCWFSCNFFACRRIM